MTPQFIRSFAQAAAAVPDCTKEKAKTFFGLPVWYKYLDLQVDKVNRCAVNIDFQAHPNDIWLIALGVVDILLRLAGIVAVVYIMYAGFLYLTSQGEPENTKHAKDALIGAIIGLIIVLIATQIVSFIGNRL